LVVAIGITLAFHVHPDMRSGMLDAAVFILLVSIMAIDWQWYRIPNALTGGLVLIAGLRIIIHPDRIPDALYGALVGAGLLLILGIAGWILQGEYGFGMGDIKLIAALGLLAGPVDILQTLIWAIIIGGLLAGVGLVTGRLHRHSRLPFAVFLGMGIYMQKIIQPLELIREVGIWQL
jgi:prepilin signal peptidase PulO-like enzyme (type II secretory pathway)